MRLRLVAALSYAVAALIPMAYLFGRSLWSFDPGPERWSDWLLLILPSICGAIGGFAFGVPRRPRAQRSGWRSALRGAGVALFGFLLLAILVGVFTAVDEGDWSYSLMMPPFVILFGGASVGWLILLVGAGAGWLFERILAPHREGEPA